MRGVAAVSIAVLWVAGCGVKEGVDGTPEFSRLAFLRNGNIHRGAADVHPVSGWLEGPHPSQSHPDNIVFMEDGALLALYGDLSVARVDGDALHRRGAFDCDLDSIYGHTFRAEGNLLMTTARGSWSVGTGEEQKCSFAIEAMPVEAAGSWRFSARTVRTNGDRLAIICGDSFDGQRVVELVDLGPDGADLLARQTLTDCPVLQPGADRMAFRDDGRLMVGPATAATEASWLVSGYGGSLAWSPDGRSLLVDRGGGDWAVIDAADGRTLGTLRGAESRWAAGSNHLLAFETCEADGTRVRVHAHEDGMPLVWSTDCGAWGASALSPAGDALAVTEHVGDHVELVVMHRDGGVWALGEGTSPTWRPDGP